MKTITMGFSRRNKDGENSGNIPSQKYLSNLDHVQFVGGENFEEKKQKTPSHRCSEGFLRFFKQPCEVISSTNLYIPSPIFQITQPLYQSEKLGTLGRVPEIYNIPTYTTYIWVI